MRIFTSKFLFCILFCFFIVNPASAQFIVNAGADQFVCPGAGITIGGSPTATGGKAPYTYSWSPTTGLSNKSLPNPSVSPLSDITYTITVRDDTGAVRTDIISLFMTYISYVDAGPDTNICINSSAVIGGIYNVAGKNVTYSWTPSAGLNDTTLPRPTATITQTTTYKLTSTMPGCTPKTDLVTVTVIPPPPIDAGNDITIKEGEVATLQGSGAFFYTWWPTTTLTYYYTATPNAEPIVTTKYYLFGTDATKTCRNYDSVTVFVEPADDVVFYNTFTPNGDGNNDTWYIGNILKFPNNKLEIYNRYGKLVYRTKGYMNTWDGKAFGEELPAATYFYSMDLGDGGKKFHGTVTIIK